jgi:hypothetical protein
MILCWSVLGVTFSYSSNASLRSADIWCWMSIMNFFPYSIADCLRIFSLFCWRFLWACSYVDRLFVCGEWSCRTGVPYAHSMTRHNISNKNASVKFSQASHKFSQIRFWRPRLAGRELHQCGKKCQNEKPEQLIHGGITVTNFVVQTLRKRSTSTQPVQFIHVTNNFQNLCSLLSYVYLLFELLVPYLHCVEPHE